MSKNEGNSTIGVLNTDNIPWADDDAQVEGATTMGSSAETVSSEESRRRRSLMARRSHTNPLYIKIPQNEPVASSSKNNESPGVVSSDDDEHPGPLKEKEEGERRGLRRNSISLPTLNAADLEALVAVHDAAQEVRDKQTRKVRESAYL
ncbi:hypothetical protein DMENIID0001_007180 [Sergentomyia squamirostris]